MRRKWNWLLCLVLVLLGLCLLFLGGCQQDDRQQKTGLEYNTLEEVNGKPVAVVSGMVLDLVAKQNLPQSPCRYYNTYADCLAALKSGKVEAFPCDEPVARELTRVNSGIGYIRESMDTDPIGMGISKNRPELKALLDAGIERFIADGRLQEIDDIWFGDDDSRKQIPAMVSGPKGTLICGIDPTNPPMCYIRDGRIAGYEADLAVRILQEAGYDVEFRQMDFSGLIPALVSGKADFVLSSMTILEERKKSILFTVPEYDGNLVLMVRDAGTGGMEKSFFSGLRESFYRNFILEERYKMVFTGLQATLTITVAAAILGTILGFIVCLLCRSRIKLLSLLARIFVKVMQGMPLVVFLMIMYYMVFGRSSINPIYVAILAFAINMAAYVSQMMRAGIDAVDPGQWEAACAMGFTRAQTFMKIIAPQAIRHILPVYTGELISMMKMTSVVGYIAIQDLTKMSDIIRSRTYEAFFPLIITALIYLLVAWILTAALSYLEYRIDPKQRPRTLKGVKL